MPPYFFLPKRLRYVVLVNGDFLEVFYGEGRLHIISETTMLGKASVIASGRVTVTNLEMASTLTPTFTAPYILLSFDCLDFCVKPLSLPSYLPPSMTYPESQFLLHLCLHMRLHLHLYQLFVFLSDSK